LCALFVLAATAVTIAEGLTATPGGAATGLTVSDLNNGSTTAGLANALVGTGVSVSNVTYTGDNRAAGTFSGGTGIIGFDSGIVLDTGRAQTYPTDGPCSGGVEGPNTCYEATGGNSAGPDGSSNSTGYGNPGDTDLTTLAGFPTFDAAVLEFDFVPKFSTVQFKYVFSSEEYSDYSNTQYNDVFGFFVNGTNCALVPGTTEPVSVNTINDGNDTGGDATPHNAQYFVNNVPPTLNTQMDGLTTVLTCNATVNPNVTNHMKLAIADGSDDILDSAVFLQAQSFSSGTTVATSLSGGGNTGASISVPTSTPVTDTATLSGGNVSTAGGTVTYNVYSDSACTSLVTSGGTVGVTSGTPLPSNPVALTNAGTYYWQAVYSGDPASGNNGVTATCGTEVETVTSPTTSSTNTTSTTAAPTTSSTSTTTTTPGPSATDLRTSLSGSDQSGMAITVLTNTDVTDTATLMGNAAGTATGTITYDVYSDSHCTTLVNAGTPEPITTPGTLPPSSALSLSTAGTYYWQATYSGDTHNAPATSPCGSEVECVICPTSTSTTTTTVAPTTTTTWPATTWPATTTTKPVCEFDGGFAHDDRPTGLSSCSKHQRPVPILKCKPGYKVTHHWGGYRCTKIKRRNAVRIIRDTLISATHTVTTNGPFLVLVAFFLAAIGLVVTARRQMRPGEPSGC